ncbi:sperm-associated antigen 8 [Coturnix japonica]|uniref:Sperm associated antigen 8 n=1 Tax=Coturnix japonica TaxID=93934 RepID=A0A8C2T142_COTJA|nr:sperm-associated antigen 8 [Coturnix japonica]
MEMRGSAMQRGARRGPETPHGVALTGHVVPVYPEDGARHRVRLQGEALLPVVAPCRRDTPVFVAEQPRELMTVPTEHPGEVLDAEEEHHEVPPALTEEPPKVPTAKDLPEVPAEQLECNVPQGTCLTHSWQEEGATDHLDNAVQPELGSEGFAYQHGHHKLPPPLHPSASLPSSTTSDAICMPYRIPPLAQGQQEAMLYQKYRPELMEEIHPLPSHMEAHTMHRDYTGGFQPTPPPASKPHNYHMEQPYSFWMEHIHNVPGVTCIRTGDSPFRRNAAFSTPITEYLEQPLPHQPVNRRLRPSMK